MQPPPLQVWNKGHQRLVQFADINQPDTVGRLLSLLGGNKVLATRLLACSHTTLYQVVREHRLE